MPGTQAPAPLSHGDQTERATANCKGPGQIAECVTRMASFHEHREHTTELENFCGAMDPTGSLALWALSVEEGHTLTQGSQGTGDGLLHAAAVPRAGRTYA